MKRLVILAVFLLLTGGGIFAFKLIAGKPFSFNHAIERIMFEGLLIDPETLTYLGILDNTIFDFHSNKLTDASPAFEENILKLAEKHKELVLSYNTESLDEQEKLTKKIILWHLNMIIRGGSFGYHFSGIDGNGPYPANQLFGIQSDLPTLLESSHQIVNLESAENYLQRLAGFEKKFDQLIESLKWREAKGVLPPRFVVEKVMEQVKGFIVHGVHENILYTSFKEKIEKLKNLDAMERKLLLERTEAEIIKTVYPSYRKLNSYFLSILSKTNRDAGLWKLPRGGEYYAYLLEYHTTTKMTPNEIHLTGLREVKRIEKEMIGILADEGYAGISIAAALKRMTREERFIFPDNDKGRTMILEGYRNIITEMERELPRFFAIKDIKKVQVKRVPVFKEKTSPSAYYHPPSLDGSRPGIFYANLRDVRETPKFGMRTLAYHEAVPGHHFQVSLAQGLEGIPTFRRVFLFTAYVEGWALYAERLAWEKGFHKDPYSNLGRLQAELFRAVRLVVDTGIHEKKWTRERAIKYMLNITGMPRGDVVAEVERYIVLPGQACAYKIGMLKLLKLRNQMKEKTGSKFDIKDFHSLILNDGAMPLDILNEMVHRHVERHYK